MSSLEPRPPRLPRPSLASLARTPGFLGLSAATVVLFYRSGFLAWGSIPVLAALKLPLLLGLGIAIVAEARGAYGDALARAEGALAGPGEGRARIPLVSRDDAIDWLCVVAAALLGYLAGARLGLGAVLVSSLLGLSGALLLPKHAVAVYCGSFAGMAAPVAFETVGSVALAGGFSGLLYVSCKPCFQGVGGRLGAAAYAGSLGASLFLGIPLIGADLPALGPGLGIVAYAALGAVATRAMSIRLGHGPVLASAFLGAVAGALLPALHGPAAGRLFDAAFFCGSFVGMSSAARLRNEAEAALAGMLCGLAFILALPWLGGAGGKLGTLAFGAVLGYLGLRRLFAFALRLARGTTGSVR